ncbi:OmpA family protein [Lichenihabitans sp. Uapishka_5]|uniref:OmpA family protein n=1 Tax=Lichenihabitans sp. Uapishka_5 TaxID=3037302 RepID=UPI0029E7DD0D|nr:OmpA family protein [Lichenihabitans sp. Uapishka_5]MDX7950254.1 OmpA family protein [Lichenihabitans sp. Uapishka_5]
MLKQSLAPLVIAGCLVSPAHAQDAPSPAPTAASSAAPAPLVILFDTASNKVQANSLAVLDKASRAYSEGKPIVMIITASSDRVGNAALNLRLSQQRATAVLNGLLERGIPADRFQLLAKGQTELPIPTQPGVSEARNRAVEITWR